MRYIAAYLLASLNNKTPTTDSIKKILNSVGVEIDEARLTALMTEMEGKDVQEIIAAGSKKLAKFGGAAPAAAGAAAAGEAAAAVEEEEEEEEEADMGAGMDMFGGGSDY